MSKENSHILNEIESLLRKIAVGNEITFNQFTNILDKDNRRTYKRQTLLAQRERFFKGKEAKRGKGGSHEICMPLEGFVDFLDFLTKQKNPIDLKRFKKTVCYCINNGIIVGK